MDKVSVIIPVHNQSKSVARAVDSIVGQDYPNLEIIAVNDGSTDGTAEVLEKYGSAIKTVSFPCRLGPYQARFAGLGEATGDWIGFVDSDDRLEISAIRHCLVRAYADNADIVQMKILRKSSRLGTALPCSQRYLTNKALDAAAYNSSMFPVQCWGKLYRHKLVSGMKDEAIGYEGFWGEDRLFNLVIFSKRPSITVCPEAKYYYYWGGGTTRYISRLKEFAKVASLKAEYLSKNGLRTTYMTEAIQNELTELAEYDTRQMINGGYPPAEVIDSLEEFVHSEPFADKSLSPTEIYHRAKRSPQRFVKKLIRKFI